MDVHGIQNPAPPYAREDPFPTPQGPPPAYEHPPVYEDIFGPAEPLGDPMQMTELPIIPDNHIVEEEVGAGPVGHLCKAYARAKKWVARQFRR